MFIGKNKYECLTTRNSVETENNYKQRLSYQMNNFLKLKNMNTFNNDKANKTLNSPFAPLSPINPYTPLPMEYKNQKKTLNKRNLMLSPSHFNATTTGSNIKVFPNTVKGKKEIDVKKYNFKTEKKIVKQGNNGNDFISTRYGDSKEGSNTKGYASKLLPGNIDHHTFGYSKQKSLSNNIVKSLDFKTFDPNTKRMKFIK
jgi:hypothetical protein